MMKVILVGFGLLVGFFVLFSPAVCFSFPWSMKTNEISFNQVSFCSFSLLQYLIFSWHMSVVNCSVYIVQEYRQMSLADLLSKENYVYLI